MLVQEARMDYVANNLANVNTVGYKANAGAVKSFPQMLVHRLNDTYLKVSGVEGNMDLRPMVGLSTMGAVTDEIATDFSEGDLRVTNEKYDLAIDGNGFFLVETPYGTRMTRAGNFTLNANQELVTKDGYRVLGEKGPVKVDGSTFVVDDKGTVYSGNNADELVDRLMIVNVDDYRTIKKEGENLFSVPAQHTQPTRVTDGYLIRQGALEGSNVNAVSQLRDMISVMRIYEANSKLIQTKDSLLSKAATEIAGR